MAGATKENCLKKKKTAKDDYLYISVFIFYNDDMLIISCGPHAAYNRIGNNNN